jgi:DNA-binding transcriptional MerR regulator
MNDSADGLFSAPQLADDLGVTARTLRFYEAKGLLKPRRIGNRRVYDRRDRARLQIILRGKRLGFSLAEIAEYLELYHADPSQVEQIRRLESMLDRRLESLEQQRAALETTLEELSEIRLQVMRALEERGISPALPPAAVERRLRPRIRPKAKNAGGRLADAIQGDD